MKKKIKKLLLSSVLIILISIISLNLIDKNNLLSSKEYLKRKLDPRIFAILQLIGDIDRSSKKLNNDYNTTFLPLTQFINLDFTKINFEKYFENNNIAGYAKHLRIKVRQVFYIDNYFEKIIFLTSDGKLFFNDYEKIINGNKLIEINNNLKLITSLDLLIDNNNFYISGVEKENNCAYLVLYKANFETLYDNLKFKNIFKSKECMEMIQSGRLAISNNKLYLATAANILNKKNEMDDKPQNDSSIYGKILEFDLNNNNYRIFSKGHRNILGLYIDENVILSTENGPRGGDEINKIEYGKNYGWPIVSYGQKYNNNEFYPNSHSEYGFEEPIYAFVPSVGISQIEKISGTFSSKWEDNFLVSSLNGNHIYRIKFDNNFQKVFFIEKIFIGERMRDLLYLENKNVFLIALENSGSLGILSPQVVK